jgi:SecD/SecF fusion protein
LEFKLVEEDTIKLTEALKGNVPAGYELKYMEDKPILVNSKAELSGDAVKDARVDFSQQQFGMPYVGLTFTSVGGEKFAKLTRNNIGKRLAIILDGKIKSAPVIQEEIPSGNAQISGRFTQKEADDLAIILRVGSLPAPIYVEEERTVGPMLGQDSIKSGLKACLIGCALVFIFMAGYYLLSGLIADFALILNVLFILGMLGFINIAMPEFVATLTLPGIAGIVLTVGMAVDANVLINERMREELSLGKSLRVAIANGYDKAFSAIFDSNLTTIIASVLLFWFGTGPIKGFAVTLTIGLVASMFTAIVVTRNIFDIFFLNKNFKSLPMLNVFKKTHIDFFKYRFVCYALSLVVIGYGLFSYAKNSKNVYGVDFAGGQLQEYSFEKDIELDKLRAKLKEVNLGDVSIQQLKDNPKQIIIRTSQDTAIMVQDVFKKSLSDNNYKLLRIEKVGPIVGEQLKKKAIMALIFALAGILIYVGFRFKHFAFGIAGVLALLHDVLVAFGFLVITGRQIDLLIVTALLTIAGYSINDTIVIYDRAREIARAKPKATVKEIMNLAVNETLGRTIITSLVTMLVVASLFFFGGEILNNFAFCLFVGFISGVYSTVYIVSPLVISWEKRI